MVSRIHFHPLLYTAACYTGNPECTALLLTCGASTKIKNKLGLTARQEARERVYGIFAKWGTSPSHVAIAEFRSQFPSVYVARIMQV